MGKISVTLITGTSRGIGNYLAKYYIKKGHIVIGCSRGDFDIKLKGYTHFNLDVSDEHSVKNVFTFIQKKYGYLDNLINNAGIASMNHTLLTPVTVLKNIVDTNYIGTFLFSREAAKIMQRKLYGRIVNFSSVAVPMRLEGETAYASSKAAIETFTKILARELGEWNITVNAIGPTPTKTDLIKSVPKEKIDRILDQQAIHRLGSFKDISNAINFFISPKSGFITGQVLYLGGV
jgi:3-oxoacyl-[acyl-carrier protein] reductase